MDELDLGLPPLAPTPKLTDAQRLRARQAERLEAGLHPLTAEPIHPELGSCGDCVHRVMRGGASKPYPKCDRPGGVPVTRGPATDVLASWPACPKHRKKN